MPQRQDYANGFYERKLKLTLGELNIKVPRVRTGKNFRPSLLPPHWKRTYSDYEELLLALISNGYSRKQIKNTLKNLGLPYQEETIQNILDEINSTCEYFKSRPLPPDWLSVSIDAKETLLRTENKKITKIIIFVATGITLDGKKEILGFWIKKGNETNYIWTDILQDLISRGITRVMLFITDNFPGLENIFKKLFPLSDHQLCMIHLIRNIKKILPKDKYETAKRLWKNIIISENQEEGITYMQKLIEIIKEFKPKMAEKLNKQKTLYTNFLNYPFEIRKYIYTTNQIESIFSGLEWISKKLGGYFPSIESLNSNIFIQLSHRQNMWNKRTLPEIKNLKYKLHQLFNLKFKLEEYAYDNI